MRERDEISFERTPEHLFPYLKQDHKCIYNLCLKCQGTAIKKKNKEEKKRNMKVPPSELTPEYLIPYLKCQGSERKTSTSEKNKTKQKKRESSPECTSEHLPYLKCQLRHRNKGRKTRTKKKKKRRRRRRRIENTQKKQESSSEYLPYLKCQGTAGRRSTGTRSLHIQP